MQTKLIHKLAYNEKTNKASLFLYNTKNNENFEPYTSPSNAFTLATINTAKNSASMYTQESLLSYIPKNLQTEVTTLLIESNLKKNDPFKDYTNIPIEFQSQVKSKKKSINDDDAGTVTYTGKFYCKSIQHLINFISCSSLLTLKDLFLDVKKDNEVEMNISRVLFQLRNDEKLNDFFIDDVTNSKDVGVEEKLKHISIYEKMEEILNLSTQGSFNIKTLDKLVDAIFYTVNTLLIGRETLQGNTMERYIDVEENKDIELFDISNTKKLNIFNKDFYKTYLKNPTIYPKKPEEETELNLLHKKFSDNYVNWIKIFDENFPILKEYFQVIFKEKYYEFIKMIAYKYQKPYEIINCSFVIYGRGRSGKSMLVHHVLPNILFKDNKGEDLMCKEQGVIKTDFNGRLRNSIITFYDEVSNFDAIRDHVKDLVTNDKLVINDKFEKKISCLNKNWLFLTTNATKLTKLFKDEEDNGRFVSINMGELLVKTMGITKETIEGQKKYDDLILESNKLVSLISNKDVFDFDNKDKNYKATPVLFSSINNTTSAKNDNNFFYFLPFFQMLKNQITKLESNNYIINQDFIENQSKEIDGRYLTLKETSNKNKKYKYKIGIDTNQKKQYNNFFNKFIEDCAETKGQDLKSYKVGTYNNFLDFKKVVLKEEVIDSIYQEMEKKGVKLGVESKLKFDKNTKSYILFGEDLKSIYEALQNKIDYLEETYC